jgi:arginase
MRLAVIGVPYNSSGTGGGEALGPAVLREHGLIEALERDNDVVDLGDVSFVSPDGPRRDRKTGLIAPRTLLNMIAAVRAAVARAYEDRRVPLVVGGDCPLLLGCLLAARDRLGFPVGLIFIDGHEDAWEPHSSVTGESADIELGLALGVTSLNGLPDLMSELPLLDPHEVVLLGPRDRAELAAEGQQSVGGRVIVLDDAQLRSAGLENTVGRWLDHLGHSPGRFWLHLDWDVLSSTNMPAVSYPQPGGLHWDEVRQIAIAAFTAEHLVGIDVTIYNPDLDPDRTAARRIVDFLANATGPAARDARLERL